MTPTCADWLQVLGPRLSEPLFDAQAVARLNALASALPGNLLGILEARLYPGPGPVDLSLRLRNTSEAERMREVPLPSPLKTFLKAWPQPGSLFAPVRSVWLEFDLERDPPEVPTPIPSAKLPPGVDPDWLTGTLLPALHGRPLPPNQRGLIHFCLTALPAPGYVLYAFSLRPRRSDAVRLEIFGLQPAGMLEFLDRIAPWSLPWITEPLALFEGVDRLHLSLDLTTEILPKIGIEGSFARLPEREPRWRRTFERLVEAGLCDPAKRDAVLAWSGYDTFRTAPKAWPAAAGRRGFCVRSLSHVKVVCRPNHKPEAKVYLAFGWLERSRAGD